MYIIKIGIIEYTLSFEGVYFFEIKAYFTTKSDLYKKTTKTCFQIKEKVL